MEEKKSCGRSYVSKGSEVLPHLVHLMEGTNGDGKIAPVGAGPDHCKHLGFALRGQGSLEGFDP